MVELSVLVQSRKRKILPLFFGLSCEEFRDAERRERWFQTWDAWAQTDPHVSVKDWKLALQAVHKFNGLEFVAAVGEVGFRKEVLAHVSAILPPESVDADVVEVEVPPDIPILDRIGLLWRQLFGRRFFILKTIGRIIGLVVLEILFAILAFKVIFPIIFYFVLPKGFSKGFLEGHPKGFSKEFLEGFFKGFPEGHPEGFL